MEVLWSEPPVFSPNAQSEPFTQPNADCNHAQAYSVTKAAQIHLVKALAMTTGSKIRVNSVSPGILLTVSIADLVVSSLVTIAEI